MRFLTFNSLHDACCANCNTECGNIATLQRTENVSPSFFSPQLERLYQIAVHLDECVVFGKEKRFLIARLLERQFGAAQITGHRMLAGVLVRHGRRPGGGGRRRIAANRRVARRCLQICGQRVCMKSGSFILF